MIKTETLKKIQNDHLFLCEDVKEFWNGYGFLFRYIDSQNKTHLLEYRLKGTKEEGFHIECDIRHIINPDTEKEVLKIAKQIADYTKEETINYLTNLNQPVRLKYIVGELTISLSEKLNVVAPPIKKTDNPKKTIKRHLDTIFSSVGGNSNQVQTLWIKSDYNDAFHLTNFFEEKFHADCSFFPTKGFKINVKLNDEEIDYLKSELKKMKYKLT